MDVDEALRLIEVSRSQINEDDQNEKPTDYNRNDPIGKVFLILRELCNLSEDKTVKISDLLSKVRSKKLNEDNMKDCLQEYMNLNVLFIDKNWTEVTLI